MQNQILSLKNIREGNIVNDLRGEKAAIRLAIVTKTEKFHLIAMELKVNKRMILEARTDFQNFLK